MQVRLSLIVSVAALTTLAGAAPPPPWDLVDTTRAGLLTIYNRTANASALGFPLAAGDINADGRDDLILTPMNAASGPMRERIGAGEVVILLSDGVIAGERDLATLDVSALPDDTIIVYGANQHDYLGTEVAAADLDGDGFDDAIVGAQYGDGEGEARANCGEVVILWGGMALGGRVIDLAAPPAGITVIAGADAGDRLGIWVSAADVNGDGIDDAILGADQGSGPDEARTHAGETYVLYGSAALRQQAAIDLATTDLTHTIIFGIDPEDHSGATVRGADMDGDGVGDVLIGAGLNRLSAQQGPTGVLNGHGSGGGDGINNACDPTGLNCEVGEAYVVYGVRGGLPPTIDLASPPAPVTVVYGVDRGDAYGEELFVGDFDGDGFGDLALGALTADGPGNTRSNAGDLALVYGSATLRGAVINLGGAPANVTFVYGARGSAIAGDTAMLLDLDGDRRDELVVASPGDQPRGRVQAGTVFIFFGTAARLPASIDLAAVPAELPFLEIDGVRGGDMLAYSMSLGDINGDGLRDLVLNAMGADGFLDRLNLAGDAYVLNAIEVSRAAGREPVTPAPTTPAATATETATPTETPTPPAACDGDCDGNGSVTIDELITGVRLALEAAAPSVCMALDRDGSGTVDIAELIVAVTRSLEGC
jgi:hypothetical protein